MADETIEINGTKFAYRDRGKGTPMVLVHANISDMRSWEPVESALAEKFRVIVYSRRYAWPNAPISEGADDPWEGHADDLAALIRKLDIGPAHIVGNSTGAFVGLLLARRHAELVRTLILEEPPVLTVFMPSSPPKLGEVVKFLFAHPGSFLPVVKFGATVIGPATASFKEGNYEAGLQTFARGVLGDRFYAKVSEARNEQMRANVRALGALLLGSGLPPFLEEDARKIKAPTLLMRGEHTPRFQHELNHRLACLIPGAQEATVAQASHLMHEDNPAGAVAAIVDFASKHSPS